MVESGALVAQVLAEAQLPVLAPLPVLAHLEVDSALLPHLLSRQSYSAAMAKSSPGSSSGWQQFLSTDDASAFDAAARGARSLAPAPVALPCDGIGHQIPADPEGTWLLVSGPPDAIVYLDLLEGPLPIRRVFALTPLAMHGATTATVSCSGTGSLTLERIIAAPPPR